MHSMSSFITSGQRNACVKSLSTFPQRSLPTTNPNFPRNTAKCSKFSKFSCTRENSYGRIRASESEASESATSAPEEVKKIEGGGVVDRKAGRMTYRPESFDELLDDATQAIRSAIKNGEKSMEVEFPPVPGIDNSYKGASDDFIDANIKLAISGARRLTEDGEKNVRILFPDSTELERAQEMFDYTLKMSDGVTMGHTSEGKNAFANFFSGGNSERNIPEDAKNTDIFIVINHSTIELPNVESYVKEVVQDKPFVMWNLELDTLRADLGLLGFPGQDVHFRFLSSVKPVFYIRQRDYSKSIAVAPFLINYSGALFREYPGPWQVMLKQDDSSYACIAEDSIRYTLFDCKEELMAAMGLDTEEEGSAMAFLRRGYKRSTWWEDGLDEEESRNWRT